MKGEVWLNLDYGDHEITERTDDLIVGLYIDKISVGGVEPSDATPNVKHFVGCIKVRLQMQHSMVNTLILISSVY